MLAFSGLASILGVVAFATTRDIVAGEMAYQKLWLGRMTMVFAGCILLSLCFSGKKAIPFYFVVTWVLITLGGVEAVWGLRQIYGLTYSNHSLYSLTGSFYNPGPYSGYLAMIFPLCLYEWLKLKNVLERKRIDQVKYYIAGGVMILILCVLPAGMSRSAWVATLVSGMWIYGMHNSWRCRLWTTIRKNKRKVFPIIIAGVVIIIVGGYALFQLKADSASGRLLIWKVSAMAIAQKPFFGYGVGNFAAAYGMAQEKYFAAEEYSDKEELVAGSPEYAFNEYLQIGVEYGVLFLLVVLLIIAFCLWTGIKEKRLGPCASLISFLVFAFSSYPMQIPGFAVVFYFLLAACIVGQSRIPILLFTIMIAVSGSYYLKFNQYDACKEWTNCKMLYNISAYQSAKEGYEKLYPDLKNRGAFLFEYGHCLHKLKEYNASTEILEEAIMYSCDPMILNIIGKNYQAMGEYEKAEEYFLRSTHRLPGRIYPYYLLAKLYAEPAYRNPEKLKQVAEVVLTKEPKVQSTAIKEMRKEVKELIMR